MKVFPPQHKDKDRRKRKLFAIWSINKNANSGKPFLSCDNGGVVIVAPKDSETDGPTQLHNTDFFIFKLKHSDKRKGIYFILQVLLFVKMISPVSFSLCHDSDKSRCWTDLLAEVSVLRQEQAKVCQSISRPTQWCPWRKTLEGQACWKCHPARTFYR